jgi:Bacterial Ig domain
VITGRLVEFKMEADSDYHLVITDDTLSFSAGGSAPPSGHSFVAEIPDPNCITGAHGNSSPTSLFIDGIRNARQKFQSHFSNIQSGAFNDAGGIPVQLVGIGFFDFPHGQVGRAPNNIEIHPVLDIVFNPPQTVGSFAISAIPSQVSLARGGTASPVVATVVNGGFNSDIAVSVSGMPPNVSATLDATSIAAPGGGSLTLSLNADLSTPPGNYTLTITGSGGGMTQVTTVALTVVAGALPPPVAITSPANGTMASGVVNVVAQPTGPGAVKLEIYIDGELRACNFDAASISYPWNTASVTNGRHTIFSKAYNGTGSASTSSLVVANVFH